MNIIKINILRIFAMFSKKRYISSYNTFLTEHNVNFLFTFEDRCIIKRIQKFCFKNTLSTEFFKNLFLNEFSINLIFSKLNFFMPSLAFINPSTTDNETYDNFNLTSEFFIPFIKFQTISLLSQYMKALSSKLWMSNFVQSILAYISYNRVIIDPVFAVGSLRIQEIHVIKSSSANRSYFITNRRFKYRSTPVIH